MTYMSVPEAVYEEACANEIFRTEVGSTLHGTGLPGHEDLDLVGITIMPPSDVLGMDPFEQVVWRTADGPGARSTADDIDLTIYSLRKYLKLAAAGNPSILVPLWAPEDRWTIGSREDDPLWLLMKNRGLFITKNAGEKFRGYALAQRSRMVDFHDGKRAPRSNRPELVEQFGYDTKFAMHMFRLCIQGIELIEHGEMTLPVPDPEGDFLREVRNGGFSYDEVIALADVWITELEETIDESTLPERADMDKVNQLSRNMHFAHWSVQ